MINFFKEKPQINSQPAEKVRAHIFVSGKVQGVFFREKTRQKAEKLGVFGWVKNLKDGRLEAVFEGDKERVKELVNWARKGPIWAKVNGLELTWEDYRGEFNGFEIGYDL